MVEIDCEKSIKLETSPNVTKSKRRLHWCRSSSNKYLCRFYYSISQKVITLSGRRFVTVSGVFITLSGSYYIIWRFLLHYRARITVSGVYYIIGWYTSNDGLSSKLLKLIKHETSKAITLIVNQSLNTGIFPDKLKCAQKLYRSIKKEIIQN